MKAASQYKIPLSGDGKETGEGELDTTPSPNAVPPSKRTAGAYAEALRSPRNQPGRFRGAFTIGGTLYSM